MKYDVYDLMYDIYINKYIYIYTEKYLWLSILVYIISSWRRRGPLPETNIVGFSMIKPRKKLETGNGGIEIGYPFKLTWKEKIHWPHMLALSILHPICAVTKSWPIPRFL